MNARILVFSLAASLIACSSISFAANAGAGVTNSPIPIHELNFSPAFTPQNGYTGNLTLLAVPLSGPRNPDVRSEAARAETAARVERLRAVIQSAQDEERALDAKVVATETRLKELEAERDALRARKEAVQVFIREKLVMPGPLLMGPGSAPASSKP